ncbi:hypothetical protein [Nitrospira sp. Kam-Ns4a]
MRDSWRTGFSFGLTSGIITTLGLIVGLYSGTHSRGVVVGGILTIALADAFSDALGIHVAQEAQNRHTGREVWEATAATLASKFLFALSFLVPVLALPLGAAVGVSIVWGVLLLAVLSLAIARARGVRPWPVIGEHVAIAVLVVALTHLVGGWIGARFSE